MANLERQYGDQGLRVIGVHAPEFEAERNLDNVQREVRSLGITHPVVIDQDMKMWEALANSYWPAFYLVDRKGQIRRVHVGETHAGSREALDFERRLAGLLKEPG